MSPRNLRVILASISILFLVGCESQPAAGPLPVNVAKAAPALSPAPESAPSPAPAGSGFSLPIGADIPTSAGTASGPNSPARRPNIPPLGQQPFQGNEPGQNPPSSSPAAPIASPPPAASAPSIHLSAGIAVPQNLPIGTVMALSVDYSLRSELRGSSRYLWVVKSGAGEFVNEVKLDSSGNLSAFFQQLRPEHRPFSVRIEELTPGSNRRTVISNEVTLKTDY